MSIKKHYTVKKKQNKYKNKTRKQYGGDNKSNTKGDKIISYADYKIIKNIAKKITDKSILHFQKVFNRKDATNVYIRAKMLRDNNIIKLLDAAKINYESTFLLHSFRDISPKLILEPGKLLSISKQTSNITSNWYSENNVNQAIANYKHKIFTELSYKGDYIRTNDHTIYLLLDIGILNDSEECAPNNTYICDRWNFAKVNDNCIPYTGNINDWINFLERIYTRNKERFTTAPFGTPGNEVTIQYCKDINNNCVKSEISLKKYLKAIVISEYYTGEYTPEELKEMYPEYNWIII